MARSDGTVYIDTLVDTQGFGKGVNNMQKQVDGLGTSIKKLGGTIAKVFAVKQLIDFGKKAIELGSDLQEVQNVVDVTFSSMSKQVDEFAKGAAEAAGLSETMAKRYVGTFGAMAKAFGFAESEAFNMSTSLTQLAGDVASFYNLTQDEAYTKLKAVFTGETESLKDLGVVMTQSALDSFAMAEGFGKTTKAMTEQEKVALRYQFVLNQLSGASGDFQRTSDGWANQVRILKLNIESIMANIGQGLINFFTPVIKVINTVLSKIATLANYFKSFSELIMGKKATSGGGGSGVGAIGDVTDGLGDLTSGYEDASDGADKLTESTKKADKANRQYLSGLDEIRTYQSDMAEADTSAAGTGNIAGNVPDFGTINFDDSSFDAMEDSVNAVIERAEELANIFKEGFKEGLGDTKKRLESIKKSVKSIGESLAYIFDEETAAHADSYVDSIVKSLGQITGAGASIGLTLGANLIGGVSQYLQQEKGRIKKFIINMFDMGSEMARLAGEMSAAIAYIFEPFGEENGQRLTSNIIAIFSNSFMSITELMTQFALDVQTLFIQPFIDSKEEIQQAFDDLLEGLANFTGDIRVILDELFALINQMYQEYIHPIFLELIPEVEALYQEHIAPLMTKVGEFFTALGDALYDFWDGVLKPFIEWFKENIMPVISPILEEVAEAFVNHIGTMVDQVGNLLDTLKGLLDFLGGVFSGDWDKIWDGLKDAVKNTMEYVITKVADMANGVVSKLNAMIDGVNGFGSKWGIDIPKIPNIPTIKIPQLATGAVIPPNAPFMAMLGDQKHGTNIEAPLDTIKQAVRDVVGNNGNGATYHFVAQLNGQTLFEQFVNQAQLVQMSTGQNPITSL